MSFFLGYNIRLHEKEHALPHQLIGLLVQYMNNRLAALEHEQKWCHTTGQICYKV